MLFVFSKIGTIKTRLNNGFLHDYISNWIDFFQSQFFHLLVTSPRILIKQTLQLFVELVIWA